MNTPISLQPSVELLDILLNIFGISGLVVEVFDGNPEAGFAQNYLWYAAGSALAYGINSVLCLVAKALILIALSVLAGAAFVSLEMILHFAKKSAAKETEAECREEQREHFLLHENVLGTNSLKVDK